MLKGKTIVVTGVGPGLGGEVARCAIRDGANVVLAARTKERLVEVAKKLDPLGKRVAYKQTDITQKDQVKQLADVAVDRFGGIDALVHVAAYNGSISKFLDTPIEEFRTASDMNIVGTASMLQVIVPYMQGKGRSIVLIGSQSSFAATVDQSAYAVSKGGIITLTYYLARELGAYGIRVNSVVPSWMWGPNVEMYVQFSAAEQKISEKEVKSQLSSKFPLGEIPSDDDVAEVAVFLCSDRARSVNGQSILVNGGEFMR
jgi:NAD(P)-dependent dehydrogenase (short-subunit alcohol dehydrogenase family)